MFGLKKRGEILIFTCYFNETTIIVILPFLRFEFGALTILNQRLFCVTNK